MKALTKIATVCLASVTLFGCAGHSHRLVSGDVAGRTIGSISHEGGSEPTMFLEFGEHRFESRGFVIQRSQNLEELRREYGFGSKHWERISSGLDTDHYLYAAEPELRAADGTTLQCSLAWRTAGTPSGICVFPDGKEIKFRSE